MRHLTPIFLASAVAFPWFSGTSSVGDDKATTAPSSEELDRALASFRRVPPIFNALVLQDVKAKRWVVVDVGPADWGWTLEGWLVSEKPDAITVLDHDGSVHSLRIPRPGESRPKPKKDEAISLDELSSPKNQVAWNVRAGTYDAFCKKFLEKGLPAEKKDGKGAFTFFDSRHELLGVVVDGCRYGHWAERRGEKRLALQLYSLAQQAHQKYSDTYGAEDAKELHERVANTIAGTYRRGAVHGAHGNAPRLEILAKWEVLLKIPHHQYQTEAKQAVADYKDLIAEDRSWKEPDADARAKLTKEQQVAYWMYHLRDADVYQTSDPGMCNVVSDSPFWSAKRNKETPNPAVELKKLGMAAIPQVIAHLNDSRPTRCQGHWRSYAPDSYYILRYGDCCQQIFEAITAHTIYERESTSGYPMRDDKGKECKDRAERWWRDYREKGEKQMLVEGTEAGNRDSVEQARRLLAKYPETAAPAILKGAQRSKDSWVRACLIRAAGEVKDDRVLPFLGQELQGPHLQSRIAAARELTRRGKRDGVQALQREWKKIRWGEDDREDSFAVTELIACLARCGNPAGIQLLASDFAEKPIGTRSEIVKALGQLTEDLQGRPLPKIVHAAADDLLAQSLSDTDEESSLRGGSDGKEVRDPAIGDLAAEVLAERWGQPRLFDIYGRLGHRERQRLEMTNVWLKKRGKDPIPLPEPRKIEPAPDAQIRPLLAAVSTAKTPGERQPHLDALRKQGLPALPAIHVRLRSLKPDHPARKDLETLAGRLALTVAEARFHTNSATPSDEFRKRVEALRGTPITEERFLDLLLAVTRDLPPKVRGICLSLERPGDDTGAILVVTLVPDKPSRPGLSPQLAIRKKIILDQKAIEGGISGVAGIDRKAALSEIEWQPFMEKLWQAFDGGSTQYLLVRVGCEECR
jgi:hypothetical protein